MIEITCLVVFAESLLTRGHLYSIDSPSVKTHLDKVCGC